MRYRGPKMYINNINTLFELFAVEPALPDPNTYKEEFFSIVETRDSGPLDGAFRSNQTFKKIEFRRVSLIDATGRRFYYWKKMGE